MYSSFKHLLDRLEGGDGKVITYKNSDSRLMFGIILYRVILVDGHVRSEELELFRRIAETHLDISEDELSGFEETVEELARSREKFDHLIDDLKKLSNNKKDKIIEFMQDISISDREFHELELNLVSQVDALIRD
ncbi:MAG: TerB family tellurite resistance protein [Rhizobiaceae bacterium]